MGRLVTNDLPAGKKADIRAQIDLMKEVSHCGTVKVGQECAGETGRWSGPILFILARDIH